MVCVSSEPLTGGIQIRETVRKGESRTNDFFPTAVTSRLLILVQSSPAGGYLFPWEYILHDVDTALAMERV